MKNSRYSKSRQKVCSSCAAAKAKCDRAQGRCSRCTKRDLQCDFTGSSTEHRASRTVLSLSHDNGTITNTALPHDGAGASSSHLDFSGLDLVCTINADDIRARWLYNLVPVAGQMPKEYPAGITNFIAKTLNAYSSTAMKGRDLPPFIHPLQLTNTAAMQPLAMCLSLLQACPTLGEGPAPTTVAALIKNEMASLYQNRHLYDELSMLAAFQALLVYAMAFFFRLGGRSDPYLKGAIQNLQDLAGLSARHGLVCRNEQCNTRPTWESWIIAETKRRTLYTLYLFDNVLSAVDATPTTMGTELEGLPAPSSKVLWEASSRQDWEAAYNLHIMDWPSGGLRLDELWPVPAGLDSAAIQERRRRVEQWVESVDVYGTMMHAVTSCTYGS